MAKSLVMSTDRNDRYVRNKVWETEINANDTVSRGRQHGIMKFFPPGRMLTINMDFISEKNVILAMYRDDM